METGGHAPLEQDKFRYLWGYVQKKVETPHA
jgi:hypothetical protein